MITYDFDDSSIDSIKRQAEKVLHKSLNQVLDEAQLSEIRKTIDINRKGLLGNVVEKYIFNKEPDIAPEPDFPKAKLELKTTPIKTSTRKGFSAKERLVLGMIDYDNIIGERWETSGFLRKNANLLILFYLFKKHLSILDSKFTLIKLLKLLSDLPPADILQLKNDWEAIAAKIRGGKAHELSEGDTFYLGACTKGATYATNFRAQPRSEEKAQRRAFSLKPKYLNFIIAENRAAIAQDHEDMIKGDKPKSIEEFVHEKLDAYLNMPADEIPDRTGIYFAPGSKGYYADLARAMLGAKSKKITEFEKADVTMKTIRLQKSGTPKESMSFPAMDYMEIVKENWEDSTLRDMLSSKKFLFLVYQYDSKGILRFTKHMFWNIPYSDLEGHVKKVWEKTVELVKTGHADKLPGIKNDPVCHVRPHGKNKNDKAMTPYGIPVTKKCFWLNASYIAEQIKNAKN